MKRIILLTLLICMVGLASASSVQLSDIILNSTALNTTLRINATETVFCDGYTVNISEISIDNYNYTISDNRILTDINITISNARYQVNSTASDLPTIVADSPTQFTVSSGLADNLTSSSIRLSVTTCEIESIKLGGTTDRTFTCANALATLSDTIIQGSQFYTVDYTTGTDSTVDDFIDGLSIFALFVGVIVIAIVGLFIFNLFLTGRVTFEILIQAAVALFILAMVVIILIAVLGQYKVVA